MALRLREGKPAKYNYRPVYFSHIPIEPGATGLLTADPWGYPRAYLSQEAAGYRTAHRKNAARALHDARLAEGFYAAMADAHNRAKGVLAYYGMLNLVKAFLAISDVELETRWEHHGLTLPLEEDDVIRVSYAVAVDGVKIFHEFAALLETPVTGGHDLTFSDVCAEVPELHQLLFELDWLPKGRKFLPVEIRFLVNENHDRLFGEVRFRKRQDTLLPTHKFLRGERAWYLKDRIEVDDWVVHQTKALRAVNRGNWPVVYRNRISRFQSFRFASILTRTGYRYYCDLEPPTYHHVCYSLVAMFDIGSVTRYRPTVVDEIFVGLKRPIATEALALVPRQVSLPADEPYYPKALRGAICKDMRASRITWCQQPVSVIRKT